MTLLVNYTQELENEERAKRRARSKSLFWDEFDEEFEDTILITDE